MATIPSHILLAIANGLACARAKAASCVCVFGAKTAVAFGNVARLRCIVFRPVPVLAPKSNRQRQIDTTIQLSGPLAACCSRFWRQNDAVRGAAQHQNMNGHVGDQVAIAVSS